MSALPTRAAAVDALQAVASAWRGTVNDQAALRREYRGALGPDEAAAWLRMAAPTLARVTLPGGLAVAVDTDTGAEVPEAVVAAALSAVPILDPEDGDALGIQRGPRRAAAATARYMQDKARGWTAYVGRIVYRLPDAPDVLAEPIRAAYAVEHPEPLSWEERARKAGKASGVARRQAAERADVERAEHLADFLEMWEFPAASTDLWREYKDDAHDALEGVKPYAQREFYRRLQADHGLVKMRSHGVTKFRTGDRVADMVAERAAQILAERVEERLSHSGEAERLADVVRLRVVGG